MKADVGWSIAIAASEFALSQDAQRQMLARGRGRQFMGDKACGSCGAWDDKNRMCLRFGFKPPSVFHFCAEWRQPQDGTLHMFRGECDWVTAYSEEDAWLVFASNYGCSVDDAKLDYDQEWVQLDDDEAMYVWLQDDSTGICMCHERHQEQLKARAEYVEKLKTTMEQWKHTNGKSVDPGTTMWCLCHRIAKSLVPERKVTCGANCHYKGCPVGWPRKTCRQWCDELGRGLVASTEV